MKNILKRTKLNDLNKLLEKAFSYIDDNEFEEALELYNDINEAYNLIRSKEKTASLIRNFNMYNNAMEVYIGLKEALILAKNHDMGALKHSLDFIWNLKDNMINIPSLRNYLETNYKYCMDVYLYNLYKKEFLRQIEDVYYLMHSGWTEEAMKNYSDLLKVYNSIIKYGDYSVRATLHNKMTDLYREIRLNRLKELAYSQIAEYNFKGLPKKREKIKVEYRDIKIKGQDVFRFDNKFKDLRNLIKNNDLDKASSLFDNV